MARILVTGHNGYIGTVMTPMLLAAGYVVVGLDTDYFRRCTFLDRVPQVPALEKDLRDVVPADLHSFDAVVHLAALANDPLADLSPELTYDINYRSSVKLASSDLDLYAYIDHFHRHGKAASFLCVRPSQSFHVVALAPDGEVTPIVHCFRDGYFPFVGGAIKDEFEALRRSVSPDLIFTHCRHDLHQDHRLLCELTYNTFRNHLILEYEIPKWDGDLRIPNVYFPLSNAAAQRKVKLLLQHFPSQAGRDWFAADTFEALLRIRGVEARAPEGKAEGFYTRKPVL